LGKIGLSDIVNLPAFEEAGDLFYRAVGMTISFYDESGKLYFYPAEERCELCHMIQSTPTGAERCHTCDRDASKRAIAGKKPIAYTCHAGLTDVVVPVVVGGETIGCFYSGQSILTPQTAIGYQEIRTRVADLDLDPESLWESYFNVPVVDGRKLDVAMGLLSVICNHLVEGEIALRQERDLTREQRKLRKSAEEKARLERDLREMELKLMQAQVNPHFLFNALNLIVGQSMAEGASETARLVEELAVMLRASLATIGSLVPLEDEFDSARAYVSIFQARFGHKIDLSLDLPENLRSFEVPSLMLQPLVENALIHAFPNCTDAFRLSIKAVLEEGHVQLTVRDNGPGIGRDTSADAQNILKPSGHGPKLTGLPGVNRRLKYYYPEVEDIVIRSSEDGLQVTVRIPAKT
jgi:ligand-binding sensor protein/anti-sigma regulatory factor (Ser/Thr protein kinase)